MRTPEESREKFLASLAKCVMLQDPAIPDGPRIYGDAEIYVPGEEYLAPEEMGNGADLVHCDAASTTEICPPPYVQIPPAPFTYEAWD